MRRRASVNETYRNAAGTYKTIDYEVSYKVFCLIVYKFCCELIHDKHQM